MRDKYCVTQHVNRIREMCNLLQLKNIFSFKYQFVALKKKYGYSKSELVNALADSMNDDMITELRAKYEYEPMSLRKLINLIYSCSVLAINWRRKLLKEDDENYEITFTFSNINYRITIIREVTVETGILFTIIKEDQLDSEKSTTKYYDWSSRNVVVQRLKQILTGRFMNNGVRGILSHVDEYV